MDVAENLQDHPQQDKSTQMKKPVPFWQCAGVFLLSAGLAQRLILSLMGQESVEIITQFVLYVFAIIALETALLLLLAWILTRVNTAQSRIGGILEHGFAGVLALVLVFNVLGLLLSYTEFAGWPLYWRLSLLGTAWAVIYAVFVYGARVLFIGLVLVGVSLNLETGFQVWRKSLPPEVTAGDWRDSFEKKFLPVQFPKKPNVYFFSYNSLTPAAIIQRYLNVEPKYLVYPAFLNNGGFQVFRNVFSDRISYPSPERNMDQNFFDGSRIFHNSQLFMDPNLWEQHDKGLLYVHGGHEFPGKTYYFNGQARAPLYEIFKENGYKVLSSFQNEYFGQKGRFVDEYLIPPNNAGQCAFGLAWYHFQSMGFCEIRRAVAVESNFRAHSPIHHVIQVTTAIAQKAQDDSPWFFFVNINAPLHTDLNYHHTPEFQQHFRGIFTQSSQHAARYMSAIIYTIQKHDPDAVVLITGDHGASLSRHTPHDKLENPNTFRFVFLDAHAVMAALYPANACAEYMKFDQKYVTVSMLVRALVVCLADGDDPIDWEVDYSSPYDGVRFRDYLYE